MAKATRHGTDEGDRPGSRSDMEMNLTDRGVDAVVLISVWAVILVLTNITVTDVRSDVESLVLASVTTLATLIFFHRKGLYQTRPTLPRTDEIAKATVGILSGAAVTLVTSAFMDWSIGSWEIVLGVGAALLVLVLARGLLRTIRLGVSATEDLRRVIIVGSGQEARELAEVIGDHPESHLGIVGVVGHLPVAETHGLASLWLGPTSRLIELMHLHESTLAIVTPTGFRGEQFRLITKDLFEAGFDVYLSTGVSRLWEGRFDVVSMAHEPLVVMSSQQPARWQLGAKRVLDIIGASLILLLAAPIMLFTALAVKVEDGGPIFFTQKRVGRRSETFGMLKFRSMVTNAEELKAELAEENERTGPLFKLSRDPRITRVGSFIRETSIDELPQLINVLRGEMSLVGPRPALPEEFNAFDAEFRGRFDVRPGITGLWQVEARRNASFGAYRRLDLHYVENWTLGLDLRILLATVEQVLVTVAVLPLRKLLPAAGTDQVDSAASDTVIDLRDRTPAKFAAEQGLQLPSADPAPAVPSDSATDAV